jgi:hypothetical protein
MRGGGIPVDTVDSMMNFVIVVELVNIMDHANFNLNLWASLRASGGGGQKRGFVVEMH